MKQWEDLSWNPEGEPEIEALKLHEQGLDVEAYWKIREGRLKEIGEKGWELVTVLESSLYTFKRELQA